MTRPITRFLAAVFGLLVLTGCWFPDDFTMDVNIRADGRYAVRYEGALTSIPMLRRMAVDQLDQEAELELAEVYINDLKRDSGYQEVTYLGLGRFQVRYERRGGDLVEHPTFYFVRSNARILAMTQKEATVTIFGDRPPERYREELIAKGFEVNGTLRIWTDAPVDSHNATQVVDGAPARYEWRIQSMNDPAPRMVLRIDRFKPVP